MKLSRGLALILASIIFVVFVSAIAYKVSVSIKENKVGADMLAYSLSPEKTNYKVGDKISVPVYLDGNEVENATAYDVKFIYDTNKLRLTNATPGTFYDKYLTVKWEPKEAWFALAMTPEKPQKQAHSNLPLMTLEFTALSKTSGTQISTATSTVYVAKTGGFHPKAGKVTLTIQ